MSKTGISSLPFFMDYNFVSNENYLQYKFAPKFVIAYLTVTKINYNKKHTILFSKLTIKKTKKITPLFYLFWIFTQSIILINIFFSVHDYLPLLKITSIIESINDWKPQKCYHQHRRFLCFLFFWVLYIFSYQSYRSWLHCYCKFLKVFFMLSGAYQISTCY